MRHPSFLAAAVIGIFMAAAALRACTEAQAQGIAPTASVDGTKISPSSVTTGLVTANQLDAGAVFTPIIDLVPSNQGQNLITGNGPNAVHDGGVIIGQGSANLLTIKGATAGNPVTITASGSDTNIEINLVAKGGQGGVGASDRVMLANNFSGTTSGLCLVNGAVASGLSTNNCTLYEDISNGGPVWLNQSTAAQPINFAVSGAAKMQMGANGALTADGGTFTGDFTAQSSKNKGTITLSSGAGTATVLTGAVCLCADQTAVLACSAVVSSTTLTCTCTGGTNNVVGYLCL